VQVAVSVDRKALSRPATETTRIVVRNMKTIQYGFLLSLLFIQYFGYTQINSDTTKYNIIGFAYSKSAIRSESVKIIDNLVRKENFDSIRSLLNSSNSSLKYLAIKVCEYKSKKNIIQLSQSDKALIGLAKQSDEKIEYRSGCTIRKVYSFKELFADPKNEINRKINQWIIKFE